MQFSVLKTRVFSFFPEDFFFFFFQAGNETSYMLLHFHSIHLLSWFIFRCFFSPLFLRRVVLLMLLRHMSSLSTDETFPFFQQFRSSINAHGINIHSVWISFLPWKESFVRCICLWVICLCPSHYSLHSPPLMVEFCSPFVPVINFLWGVFQSHDSSL